MLILILLDLQNVVFSVENSLNGQNYSADSHHPFKNPIQQNFQFPHWEEFPLPLSAI